MNSVGEKAMIVSVNTIQAEGVGVSFQNIWWSSAEAGEKLFTTVLKNNLTAPNWTCC